MVVALRPRSLEEPFWLLWLIGRVFDRPMGRLCADTWNVVDVGAMLLIMAL